MLAVGLALLALVLTRPQPLPADALAGLTADAERGRLAFAAAGCSSCHYPPDMSEGPLAGGRPFATDFGTFYAPNITPHPEAGIGGWSDLDLASAIVRGVSPEGQHYYPAFPYASYIRADLQDVVDLIAHLRSLPADPTPSRPHDVGFPFSIRASLGGWKWLFVDPAPVVAVADDPTLARGQYLVEALGHCGECHTPRNVLGGLDLSRWLSGAPIPGGEGRTPGIDPGSLTWSESDIAAYLASGFTPEFDTAGGEMAAVIRNTRQLPEADHAAIAAYLKAVPAVAD